MKQLIKSASVYSAELPATEHLERLAGEGKTPVLVARDGLLAGLIGLADTPRPDARAAVASLRAMGLDVVMLTGDNRRTAQAMAATLGIEHVLAEVLPQDKAAEVAHLQASNRGVIIVSLQPSRSRSMCSRRRKIAVLPSARLYARMPSNAPRP